MRRLVPLLLLMCFAAPVTAQQCGVADSIGYPVDTQQFMLAQDFGAAQPTPSGRAITPAKIGTPGALPISAWAAGLCGGDGPRDLQSPDRLGRDGGVVIIEHTFPDGSLLYTQYGHMTETDTIKFPPQWSCIRAGDIDRRDRQYPPRAASAFRGSRGRWHLPRPRL